MTSGMPNKEVMLQGTHIFTTCSTCYGNHAEKYDYDAMIMKAQAKHLSNAQIHAVATYIKNFNKSM